MFSATLYSDLVLLVASDVSVYVITTALGFHVLA
jgi:hypothetical protein